MGDVGDAFNAMKKASREHRHDKQNWSRELLEQWCLENKVSMRAVADWQFRLTNEDGSKKIDIYPQRQKWHNLKNNTRGKYINVIALVTAYFKSDNP